MVVVVVGTKNTGNRASVPDRSPEFTNPKREETQLPGKYDHITPNLPKFLEPDAKYVDRVEEAKTKLLNGRLEVPARDLATLFVGLRSKKEETEAQLKEET